MNGSAIRSNYFNADRVARNIVSNISDSTFFKTQKGMVLRDFKDKLSGYKYADMNEWTLSDHAYPYSFLYGFDKSLSSMRYEYIYGYWIPDAPEYNYNANLGIVYAINSSYKEFQPGSEENLANKFDALIQQQGFKPVADKPNWFYNENTDMAVGLGYEDGVISIVCAYQPKYRDLDIDRVSREDAPSEDAQLDYIDTFGLENSEE